MDSSEINMNPLGSNVRSSPGTAGDSPASDISVVEVRCVVHNFPYDKDETQAERAIRSLLEPHMAVRHCQPSTTGKRVKHLSKSLEIFVQPKDSPSRNTRRSAYELVEWLGKLWCEHLANPDINDLWLETTGHRFTSTPLTGVHHMALRMVSLGAFTSPGKYVCHWKSKRTTHIPASQYHDVDYQDYTYFDTDQEDETEGNKIRSPLTVLFEFDNELLTISWTESIHAYWRMEISFDSLADRVILMQSDQSVHHMYIFIANQPKLYHADQRRKFSLDFDNKDGQMNWERDVGFGLCERGVVGSSNVIHLEIDPVRQNNIGKLLQTLHRYRFTIYKGHPETVDALDSVPQIVQCPKFETFEATYAWYCLVTRGFKVTDQISSDVISFLQELDDELLAARLIHAIGDEFDSNCVVSLNEASLQHELDRLLQYRVIDEDDEGQELEHMVRVRRILLTPTAVRALPAEYIVGNRVVREFSVDRFIRVVLRDEDMELLTASAHALRKPIEVITNFMRQDLAIGDRRYHFLGCSNSQMREHGFWMYASDGKHTVESIRMWMGDLSHERCVATYVSRLGQFFSAAKKTIAVDQECKQLISDVQRNDHCFTDGIGKISSSLAKQVTKSLGIRSSPSAFQIRYGGCKGVVSVCPDLDGEQLHVRESMEKFKSSHCELEVVQYAKPGRLYLNRQVIVLMSGLGVPNQAFYALQDNMLQQLADMLIREESAIDALAQLGIGLTLQELYSTGICVTKEPYLSSVLRNIYEHKLNNMMKKTRIELSNEDGRIMMGTADETGSLSYGEVFVQYSVNVDRPQSETKILTGTVVIAKNPCFHPGDMRKFTAVDKPYLKHMIDCVVFPTQGSRPHPDEMSGSDLDGDMYFVCWHKSLVMPGENKEPMNYKPKPKQLLDRPVTESDMIDFIGSYIEDDNLGVIANSHLAHADGQKNGIFSRQCLELSQMHSDGADFPKTGVRVQISYELRPQQYPHYMQKRDKPSYKSNHVIGKMYDQCHAITSIRQEQVQELTTSLDEYFLVPGYEDYLDDAQKIHDYYRRNIAKIMSEYGISTEAEIVTGHIIKMRKQRRGTLQREHVEIAAIINSRVKSIKAKVKNMFESVAGKPLDNNSELCRLVSAIYYVSYSGPTGSRNCLSLPWIFVSHLANARKVNVNPETMLATMRTLTEPQNGPILQQLSQQIIHFKETDRRQHDSRDCRYKAFQRLSAVMKNAGVLLSVFGSHATGFDDPSSSLDVLVSVQHGSMSQYTCDVITSIVQKVYKVPRHRTLKTGQKPMVFVDDVNSVKICLYSDKLCARRTTYVICAIAKYDWSFKVIQMLMSWAKQNKIAGGDRNSTMTTENFILLFLSQFTQHVAGHQPIDAEDKTRVMNLLVQNHFLHCSASSCSHAKRPKRDVRFAVENTKYNQHNEEKYAELMLQFLIRTSSLQGQVLKEVVDPACESGERKLFRLKDSQYQRLAERMLKAYHKLAHSRHLFDVATESQLTDQHLIMDLPQQLCERILLCEKSYAEKLKRESQAGELAIRRRPYKDSLAGLVLEAWGKPESLQLIHDYIGDEVKTKPTMFSAGSSHVVFENAYFTVFKDSSSETSSIVFENYSGPHQPIHDQYILHVPRCLHTDPTSLFAIDKFVERSLQQLQKIVDNYDERVDGNMRAVISYGTLYVANCKIQEIPENEYDGLFHANKSSVTRPNIGLVLQSHRGNNRRGRGRGRDFGHRQPYTLYRTSFIPTGNPNIDNDRVQDFLKHNGFKLMEETVEYRLSLKLSISGQQLQLQGVVVLDENFYLNYVEMPDIKWLCVNIVSSNKDGNYKPYDCRFKMQSRKMRIPIMQLRRECDDFEDIITNHRNMLIRTGNDVSAVHPDFLSRLRFVRKKHTRVYKLAANQHASTTDPFLYGMEIRINQGTEYSRPSQNGVFQKVDEGRFEITAVPDIPNLRDEDLMRTFLYKTWQFSEELGSILE